MEITVIEKDLANVPTLKDQAIAIKVIDNVTRIQAAELGKTAKELIDKITLYHDDVVKKAHEAHKAALARKNADLKPVEEVVAICRKSINDYDAEVQRLERIEQARLQKIEEEKAAKERERLLNAAIKAKSEEKQEDLLERAENVYVAPVTVAPTVAKTVQTASGNITQAAELKITVIDLKAFVAELVKSNPGALAQIVDIKTAGTKSFIKTNGIEHYPGLKIERVTGVRF